MDDPSLDMLQELTTISAQFFSQMTEILNKYLGKPEAPKKKTEVEKPKPETKKRDPKKSGFSLFSDDFRRSLKATPEHANSSLTDLSMMCGKKWGSMTEEEKQVWLDRAKTLKDSPPQTPPPASAPVGKKSLSQLFESSDEDIPPKKRGSTGEAEAVVKNSK
mmetsp:Transcript_18665/g.33749  ORF Transcript_18665/g.33749 Transcript_18665/m.33749 type:complete len:162 (+) Transcript_18665:962-1447(+)